jgi:hypothetical protein
MSEILHLTLKREIREKDQQAHNYARDQTTLIYQHLCPEDTGRRCT